MVRTARRALLFSSFLAALSGALLAPGWTPSCLAASADPVAVATQAPTGAGAPEGRAEPGGSAPAKEAPLPNQYGMSLEYGYTYDPQENLSFLMARVFAIYDYGTVWHQKRPAALRFKVEAAAGSTLTPSSELMVSVNMLALYYPGKLRGTTWRPYLEGGIGGIYTQFRVKGQGLHYNFNPLLGVGCELPQANGKNPFAAIRLHHISNAGIDHENRGVNSVELQVGRFF
jgi:lipid A 3-O-deacylase